METLPASFLYIGNAENYHEQIKVIYGLIKRFTSTFPALICMCTNLDEKIITKDDQQTAERDKQTRCRRNKCPIIF